MSTQSEIHTLVLIALMGAVIGSLCTYLINIHPEFIIYVNPITSYMIPLGQQTKCTISVEDPNKGICGYENNVYLYASGQPTGVDITINPIGGLQPPFASDMIISVQDPSTVPGCYKIEIEGWGTDGHTYKCAHFIKILDPKKTRTQLVPYNKKFDDDMDSKYKLSHDGNATIASNNLITENVTDGTWDR